MSIHLDKCTRDPDNCYCVKDELGVEELAEFMHDAFHRAKPEVPYRTFAETGQEYQRIQRSIASEVIELMSNK